MSEVEIMTEATIAQQERNENVEKLDTENQVDDEDLEDGEIDDDDEEDDEVTVTAVYPVPSKENETKSSALAIIDLSNDNTSSPPPKPVVPKSKKPQPVVDDHASSIENALAKALKKSGIDPPPLPKVVEPAESLGSKEDNNQTESRSSRRRKRRRQKERENKERKEKKKRLDSPEMTAVADDDDMDEFEMLNVRGGSPPPLPMSKVYNNFKSNYESSDDTDSSYDSYDSVDDEKRRHRASPPRDSRKRRDRGRKEKRSRRDSLDEKHRQEPRKLELCKFYLMECCAKRDKCSYMHSDFPCKFYYLGMECTQADDCKFSHGEPLNEQLRNILLKHIETAPKEILGNFKRISRDQAISLISKRHEELCNKFGIENNWNLTALNAVGGSSNRQQQQQQKQQQQQQQQQSNQGINSNKIPSLLDMVINPPPEVVVGQKQTDKQRKSRWADTRSVEKENKNQVPNYMDLANLKGVLSDDHIDKLTQMGIQNLEQVNQLTFGQLNQIGLTITEISEIQAKLQGNKSQTVTTTTTKSDSDKSAITTNTIETEKEGNSNSNALPANVEDTEVVSESNSNNKTGAFDYSQYLKDSNLAFDRYESYEDEKDDEQLVIDDDNMDTDGENLNQSIEEKNRESVSFNPFANYDRTDVDTRLQRERTISRSRSRSPSHTPTRSQSSTPEASDSPDVDEMAEAGQSRYERSTIYDFNSQIAAQEEEDADKKSSTSDFSSELPFKPIMNYKPATEIDGSITSHLPMTWKVYEVDLPRASYLNLRKNKSMEQVIDPRLRRILGMAELRYTLPSPAARGMRKLSNNIASPDSEEASPKYYIPPSSSPYYDERKAQKTIVSKASSVVPPSVSTITTMSTTTATPASVEPRLTDPRARKDPRRAAAAAAAAAAVASAAATNARSATEESGGNPTADGMNAASKQNVEIRNLLHKSEWYKNLNSKFKIMVNQQLALVSTELKKFHQNPSPQKIFDMSFILNNSTLQQILTQLGIYIDENGVVSHIDADTDDKSQQDQSQLRVGNEAQIALPNLSQPPPDFLRGPPPNLTAPPPNIAAALPAMPPPQLFRPALNIAPFGVLNAAGRPSLLGLPPTSGNAANNAFNHPFAAELANAIPAAAFAQGLLGQFNNFAGGPQGAAALILPNNMRNFNNNNSNGQRNNNRNRRNKI